MEITHIVCKIYNWRGTAFRAYHYHVKLEYKTSQTIEGTKFNTLPEAQEWATSTFMRLFDMRTHTLDIEIIEAQGGTHIKQNWKDVDWFEKWWLKEVLNA